jgi:crotonobetainyl-CoA:carnitine CoA-transferase CaiB-like acyl-CoA transferase
MLLLAGGYPHATKCRTAATGRILLGPTSAVLLAALGSPAIRFGAPAGSSAAVAPRVEVVRFSAFPASYDYEILV